MQSINHLVTEQQVLDFKLATEPYEGNVSIMKSFAIVVTANKTGSEEDMFERFPYTIIGTYEGTREYNKDGNLEKIHYFIFNRHLEGKIEPFLGLIFGFSSINTQLDKRAPKKGTKVIIKYQGRQSHPTKKDIKFHSCYLEFPDKEKDKESKSKKK